MLRHPPTTPHIRSLRFRAATEGLDDCMRQADSNHGKKLGQHATSQERRNDHHENLHWVATGPAIDVPE